MEKLINQSMLDSLTIKIFGEPISEYKNSEDFLIEESGQKEVVIAKVHGVKINGFCRKFDKPPILVLFGKGIDAQGCGFENTGGIKMWTIRKDMLASRINVESGKVLDIISQDIETKGLIDAGIKIKNVKYENGKLSGRVEIWVKVGVKVSHAENFSIDTGLGSWVTIAGFDLGIADVAVQVKLDSLHKVCARLKACADFPWPIGKQCARATHCIDF